MAQTHSVELNRSHIDALSPLGPLVLRVGLGLVFMAHACAKPLVFTFPGTIAFFEALGYPGWTAYPVFVVELLGGLALLLGFRTRLVALALVPVMLGALQAHLPNGWMFSAAGGGWEFVAFLLVSLGAQALLGSGAYALDGATTARSRRSGLTVAHG